MTLENDGPEAGTGTEAIAEAPVEATSEATTEQPTGAETPDEPDAGAEEAEREKRVPWFQKRINEVTADKYDALREAAYWRGKAEAGDRQQPQPAPSPQGPPREEQFATYEQFEEARIDYAVEQRLQTAREIEERGRVAKSFEERVTKVRDKLPDYDLYVGDPTLTISPLMATVIRESDVGPEVAYHLGKNRSEAQRIFDLPPHRQAAELGRLEAKLSAPQPPSTKPNPPAPPQTVSGLAAGLAKAPEEMSMDEYKAWRASQS